MLYATIVAPYCDVPNEQYWGGVGGEGIEATNLNAIAIQYSHRCLQEVLLVAQFLRNKLLG